MGIANGITPLYATPSFSPAQIGYTIIGTSYGLSAMVSGITLSTHYLTVTPGVWLLSYQVTGINNNTGTPVINISTSINLFVAPASFGNSSQTVTAFFTPSTIATYYANLTQYGSTTIPSTWTFTGVRIA